MQSILTFTDSAFANSPTWDGLSVIPHQFSWCFWGHLRTPWSSENWILGTHIPSWGTRHGYAVSYCKLAFSPWPVGAIFSHFCAQSTRRWWFTPVILVIWEAKIRRIVVRSQSRQIVCKTLTQKHPTLNRAGLLPSPMESLHFKSFTVSLSLSQALWVSEGHFLVFYFVDWETEAWHTLVICPRLCSFNLFHLWGKPFLSHRKI
jgi:hypothetical protein